MKCIPDPAAQDLLRQARKKLNFSAEAEASIASVVAGIALIDGPDRDLLATMEAISYHASGEQCIEDHLCLLETQASLPAWERQERFRKMTPDLAEIARVQEIRRAMQHGGPLGFSVSEDKKLAQCETKHGEYSITRPGAKCILEFRPWGCQPAEIKRFGCCYQATLAAWVHHNSLEVTAK